MFLLYSVASHLYKPELLQKEVLKEQLQTVLPQDWQNDTHTLRVRPVVIHPHCSLDFSTPFKWTCAIGLLCISSCLHSACDSFTLQWVVETGKPMFEAMTTVTAEASSMLNPLKWQQDWVQNKFGGKCYYMWRRSPRYHGGEMRGKGIHHLRCFIKKKKSRHHSDWATKLKKKKSSN